MATDDEDTEERQAAALAATAGDPPPVAEEIEVTDEVVRAARQALHAARALPLTDQPAALEAVHANLASRLGDVQSG